MRKIFYFIMLLFGITVANTACDDWTDMEPKFQEDMTQSSLPEEYYAQLRAYKKTDHPVAFGWFRRRCRLTRAIWIVSTIC